MSKALLIFAGLTAILLAVGIQAAVLPNISKLSPGESLGGTFSSSLKLLGIVEGKSFFAENATGRNWWAAKGYCASSGMKLASIKSPAEAAFLNQSYSESFSGFFWTSGRDALLLRRFSWDSDETEPDADYVPLGREGRIVEALQYYSISGNSVLYSYDISDTGTGVLCETET